MTAGALQSETSQICQPEAVFTVQLCFVLPRFAFMLLFVFESYFARSFYVMNGRFDEHESTLRMLFMLVVQSVHCLVSLHEEIGLQTAQL